MAKDYHELAEKLRAAAGANRAKLDAMYPDDADLVRRAQAGGEYAEYVVPQGAKDQPRQPAKPTTAGKAGPGIIGRGAQLSRDLITGSSEFGRGVVGGAISGVGRTVGDIENTIAAGLQEYAPSYAHPSWVGKDIQAAGDWVTGQPSMSLSNVVTGEKPQPSMSSQAGQFIGGLIPEVAQYAGATGVARGIVRPATKLGAMFTSGAAQGGLAAAKRAMETPVEGAPPRRDPGTEGVVQGVVGGLSDWAGAAKGRAIRTALQTGLGYLGGEGDWGSRDRATSAAIQGAVGVALPHSPIATVPRPVPRTGATVAAAAGLPAGNIASMFDPNTRPKLEDFYNAPPSARPAPVTPQGPVYGPEPQPPIQGPAPRPTPLVTNTGPDLMNAFFPQAPVGPTPLRQPPAPGGRPVATPGYTPPAPLAGEVNQPPPGPPNLGTIPPIYRAPGEPPATSTVTKVGEGVTEMDLPYGPQEQPPLQGPQPQPPIQGPMEQPPVLGPAEGPPYLGPGGGPSSAPDLSSIAKPPAPIYIPPTRPLLPPRPVPPPSPLPGQMQGLYDQQNPPPTHEIPPVPLAGFGVGREGPGTLGDVGRMGLGTTGYTAGAAPPLPMGPTTGASLGLRTPWKSAQESQEAIQRAREGTLGRPWRSQADEADEGVSQLFNTGEIAPLVTNKPKAKRGPRGTRPKMTPTGPPTPEGLIIQELDEGGAPIETPPVIEETPPPPPPPDEPPLVVGRGGRARGGVKKK